MSYNHFFTGYKLESVAYNYFFAVHNLKSVQKANLFPQKWHGFNKMSTYCCSKRTITKTKFSVGKKELIVPGKDLSCGKKVSGADKKEIIMKRIDTNIRKKETNS